MKIRKYVDFIRMPNVSFLTYYTVKSLGKRALKRMKKNWVLVKNGPVFYGDKIFDPIGKRFEFSDRTEWGTDSSKFISVIRMK